MHSSGWKLGVLAALIAGAVWMASSCGPATPASQTAATKLGRSEVSTAAPSPPARPPPVSATWDAPAARHVLDRFAFGPRPGDVENLLRSGQEAWFEQQLAVNAAVNPELERALEPYKSALRPAAALMQDWGEMTEEDGGMEMQGEATDMNGRELMQRMKPHFKSHLADLVVAQLTRQVLSPRQVEEVMIDFWSNHFNVFAPKGLVRTFASDYVERVLRPHALGRFEDLLLATARHPAMLIYLDNAASSAHRGLNENYARELLELHTLGTGAYGESDVVAVARILTGWGVSREKSPRPYEFAFRPRRHDFGQKTALGELFPAGEGEAEGVRLLQRLAKHPATAGHLATKLCARFVADEPPPSCVSAAKAAFESTGGSIRDVLLAIARDASFGAPEARRVKLKRPLELVVSALRAIGAAPDGTSRLAKALRALGEPILEESVPTGYPESETAWASSGGFLARMNFATDLGFERLPGVQVDVAQTLSESDADALLAHGNRLFLSGSASASTLEAIGAELHRAGRTRDRQRLTAALFLASPEFQRQ